MIGRNGYIVNDPLRFNNEGQYPWSNFFRPFPFFSANGFHVLYFSAFDFSAIQLPFVKGKSLEIVERAVKWIPWSPKETKGYEKRDRIRSIMFVNDRQLGMDRQQPLRFAYGRHDPSHTFFRPSSVLFGYWISCSLFFCVRFFCHPIDMLHREIVRD